MSQEQVERVQMASRYDPGATEARWYETWVSRGYFHPTAPSERPSYCIVLPPPNVTGALHIGHALDHTIQDMLIRRARMRGFDTLWLPGTDHAGIATQVVVERELRKEGIERRELGREAFIEQVWAWKERYGDRIVEQMKALGNSCDWDRLRFTMDEGLSHAVRVAFVRMYDDGLIYRGERLVNWCPTDLTALSDSEVEYEDVDGELVTFRYPLADGSGHVEVATTRVETMLGDTGIAVHPDDERHRANVGKTARHPLDGREIPIVADTYVDMGFGTGAVKVTPAHDPNDFEIAARHGLPLMNILDEHAALNDNVPEGFRGLDRYEGRRRVRHGLEELGLVVEEERPYVHAVGHCYRCHSEIEPWLSGKQWFVAVDRLKGPAREAARDGRVRFTPDRWARSYDTWLEGLRDWNISRQLWWGHRIPVWYCLEGHEFAAVEDPTACVVCGSVDIEQDPDVLDTWFSSQLWPFSTLGWPEPTADLATFYPTSVLVTGYEILYLWVARMIMSGMYLAGDVPFHQVVIHGLVRDRSGRKMSKSLGNVIDPLDMIGTYGADALRFALARMASPEQQNLPLAEEAIEAGRNFANKIWNAARLLLGTYPGGAPALPPADRWTVAERWLLSRHQACVAEVDAALDRDEFAQAASALHRFLWSEFCDWGLEVEKGRLGDADGVRADAANVLGWVLERTLRLLHPIMPFVTEEIWQRFDAGESIVVAPWPEGHPELADPAAERSFGLVQEVVTSVRSFRSDHRVPPGVKVDAHVRLPAEDHAAFEDLAERIRRLALVAALDLVTGDEEAPHPSARIDLSRGAVWIPLGGLFDLDAEIARLRKDLAGVDVQLQRSQGKLSNEAFVAKAAPSVVEAERDRSARLAEQGRRIRAQLAELGADA